MNYGTLLRGFWVTWIIGGIVFFTLLHDFNAVALRVAVGSLLLAYTLWRRWR